VVADAIGEGDLPHGAGRGEALRVKAVGVVADRQRIVEEGHLAPPRAEEEEAAQFGIDENETAAKLLNDRARRDQNLVWFPADSVDFTIELFGLPIPLTSAPEFLQMA
jgi:hypothetical protein